MTSTCTVKLMPLWQRHSLSVLRIAPIDDQAATYYSTPKLKAAPKSLDDVNKIDRHWISASRVAPIGVSVSTRCAGASG
jgi:hypothetical protein